MENNYKIMKYKKILRFLKRKPRMRFLRSLEYFELHYNRSRWKEVIFVDKGNQKIVIW